MGTKSKKKRDKRSRRHQPLRWAIGLPPTLASIRTLKKAAGQQPSDESGIDVLTLHPDFEETEKAQMDFDRAVFTKIPKVGLLRHPYESELDLRQMYEQEHGPGSAANLLLMLYVTCPIPGESSVRHKEPTALDSEHVLYKPLSQGQCALIGRNPNGMFCYGLLLQRLPIEIIADGIFPVSASASF
jgi:hypothetical protein